MESFASLSLSSSKSSTVLSLQAVRDVRIGGSVVVVDSSVNDGLAGSGLFSCSSVREAGYERPGGGTTLSSPSSDRDGLIAGGYRGGLSMMQSTSVATRTSVVGKDDKPIFSRERQPDFKVIMQRRTKKTVGRGQRMAGVENKELAGLVADRQTYTSCLMRRLAIEVERG